jgi:tol-pal system protein YbgF
MKILTMALLVIGLPAVAGSQNREELQLLADVRMLQEQVAKLQLTANQLTEALSDTNKRIDDQAASTLKSFANQQLLINNLSASSNTLREKLDDNTVRVSQLTQEMSAIRSGLGMLTEQINSLVSLLQPPVNPVDPNAPMAPRDGSAAPTPGAPLGAVRQPTSPERLFLAAVNDYMSNRLPSAIEGFEDFVREFPTAPDAPRAQIYIGQSYHSQRKYKEAIAAYGKVISDYKDSAQVVAEAYYLQGMCYLDMNDRGNAQKVFQLVSKQYPGTPSALLAEQRLKSMGVLR